MDQPDNASRIVNLGSLPYRRIAGGELDNPLKELVESNLFSFRCTEYQARVFATDTLSEVSNWAGEIATSAIANGWKIAAD